MSCKSAPMALPRRLHLDKRAPKLISLAPGRGPDELLSTRQVADWLGVSTQWLEIGRHKGYGPRFVRLSPRKVRYRHDAVLSFLRERTFQSTSGYAAIDSASDV
jgi:hypothetical protein